MKTVYKGIGLLLAISFLLTNIAGEIQAKGKGRLLNEKDLFCVKVTDNEWFKYDEYEGDYGKYIETIMD